MESSEIKDKDMIKDKDLMRMGVIAIIYTVYHSKKTGGIRFAPKEFDRFRVLVTEILREEGIDIEIDEDAILDFFQSVCKKIGQTSPVLIRYPSQ